MCKPQLSLEYGSLSRRELEKRLEDTTVTICMVLDYLDVLDFDHRWNALESDDAMKIVENIMWRAFVFVRKWTQAKWNDKPQARAERAIERHLVVTTVGH